jgi:hypothetical protein
MKTYKAWYCLSTYVEDRDYRTPLIEQPWVRTGTFTINDNQNLLDVIPENYYLIDCKRI